MKIAVIGAGIGGLHMAKKLIGHGHEVTVFEKARGVGGRMSTRKAEPFSFDHGAQCFTTRTKEFGLFLAPYIDRGIIAEWKGSIMNFEIGKKDSKRIWYEKHLVASPSMNALCKAMAEGLDIKLATEIAQVKQNDTGEHLLADINGNSLGIFDWVISSAPPAQTANLLPQFSNQLKNIRMHCCFSLMLGYNHKWQKNWIAAKVRNSNIKWISVNSSKPGRDDKVTSIVVHSSNTWSDNNVETDLELVKKQMFESYVQVSGIDSKPDHIAIHRWKYATLDSSDVNTPLVDHQLKIAATSDWTATSRIEEVWLAAEKTLAMINSGNQK